MRTAITIVAVALLALLVAVQAPAAEPRCTNGGNTLVVGDSHTYLSGCAAYGHWDVDGRPGRAAAEGADKVDEFIRARHARLVFDLGTNNHSTAGQVRPALREAWNRIGPNRKMVVVTAWTRHASINAGLRDVNAELRDFRRTHPQRVRLVEWAARVQGSPAMFSSDGVHFTGAAYAERVQMIRDQVVLLRGR